MAVRRRKHNEVEIRRRQKINEHFDELQELVGYDKKEKDKDSVLRSVIDKLNEYKLREEALIAKKGALESGASKSVVLSSGAASRTTQLVQNLYLDMAGGKAIDYSKVFSNNSVPMALGSIGGGLVDCNDAFLHALAFSREEVRNLSCLQLTHPDDLPLIFQRFKELLGNEIQAYTAQKRMLNRQGQYISFEATCWLLREEAQPKYFFCVMVPKGGSLLAPAPLPKLLEA